MSPPYLRTFVGLAAIVAAAYVGFGETWGSVALGVVGFLIVLVEVLAAEPWKGDGNGQVG